jgi:hypothetical protein
MSGQDICVTIDMNYFKIQVVNRDNNPIQPKKIKCHNGFIILLSSSNSQFYSNNILNIIINNDTKFNQITLNNYNSSFETLDFSFDNKQFVFTNTNGELFMANFFDDTDTIYVGDNIYNNPPNILNCSKVNIQCYFLDYTVNCVLYCSDKDGNLLLYHLDEHFSFDFRVQLTNLSDDIQFKFKNNLNSISIQKQIFINKQNHLVQIFNGIKRVYTKISINSIITNLICTGVCNDSMHNVYLIHNNQLFWINYAVVFSDTFISDNDTLVVDYCSFYQ